METTTSYHTCLLYYKQICGQLRRQRHYKATRKLCSWWRHQMETFSALLTICVGNSSVPGEFPAQRPVTRRFDVFFDLRLNKRLSKQSKGRRLETLSRLLWRHRNGYVLRSTGHPGERQQPQWRRSSPATDSNGYIWWTASRNNSVFFLPVM